jgi:hypothetical protein
MALSEPTKVRLLAAWEAWDLKPSSYTTASELTEAETAAAGELGVGRLVFTAALRAGRRAGLGYEAALDRALANPTT